MSTITTTTTTPLIYTIVRGASREGYAIVSMHISYEGARDAMQALADSYERSGTPLREAYGEWVKVSEWGQDDNTLYYSILENRAE